MKKYVPFLGRANIGYFSRKHGQIRCYKKMRFYRFTWSDKKDKTYYCNDFSRIISETRTCFLEHQHSMSQFSVDCFVCLPYILYFTCWNVFVLVLFLFHWPLPIIYHISALIDYLILYCFCWLFEWMWWQPGQKPKLYCSYPCI